ncbi:MAG TPA: response regulator, partial [bacterium]|nr:response regulator [bacterium]
MNQDRKHILIADDEERILSSLSMALENIGYDVSTASSGSEAMEKLLGCIEGSRPVDLLISDIQMAGMNGLELLDKINDSGLEIPVMVITGFGDKGMVVELMRKGCADYIDKPLEPVSFTNRVQAVLNSSS